MSASFVRCDAHCHIDFSAAPRDLVSAAIDCGYLLLSSTVTPEGYLRAQAELGGCASSGLLLGVGLHPRWVVDDVAQAEFQADALIAELPEADFVGEVGLDFSPRFAQSAAAQQRAFERVVRASAEKGAVLFIHAVRSAEAVLDVLERFDVCGRCACVLHWFSGTSDELTRARKLGCWFSVGERMLSGKRGRAYVRAMPSDRLLLETDLPAQPGDHLSFRELSDSLERAYRQVAEIKGDAVAAATVENACRLMGVGDSGIA
ncbi:MAG: TatD family hydrolase [Eggerthellaceae bacterium]|jgi:TatD DNase family protein